MTYFSPSPHLKYLFNTEKRCYMRRTRRKQAWKQVSKLQATYSRFFYVYTTFSIYIQPPFSSDTEQSFMNTSLESFAERQMKSFPLHINRCQFLYRHYIKLVSLNKFCIKNLKLPI